MTLYVRQQKRHRYKEDFWTLWEKAKVGWFKRIALKHAYYHMRNRSPVQVWCMKHGTQSHWTRTTLKHGMWREVGGEIIECVLTGWFAFLLKEYIVVYTLFSSRGLQCSELWGLWKWERISEPSDHMASSHCRGDSSFLATRWLVGWGFYMDPCAEKMF